MTEIPCLQTERLILREWRGADFDAYASFHADPEVMQFLGGVQSPSDAWRSLATIAGHWCLRGFGFWAVERKSDHALLGRIGLWNPEGWPGMEVGWTLAKPYWGQGYATEAAMASVAYGFKTYPVPKLISLIAPDNRASQKVAERLGETKNGPWELTIAGHRIPVEIWEVARERWSGNQNL